MNLTLVAQTQIYRAGARNSQDQSYRQAMQVFARSNSSTSFSLYHGIIQSSEEESLEKKIQALAKDSVLFIGIYSNLIYSMFGYDQVRLSLVPKTSPDLSYFKLRPDIHYVFELEIMEKHNIHNPYNQQILKGMIQLAKNDNFKISFLSHSDKMKNFLINSGVNPNKVNALPHLFLNQIYSAEHLDLQAKKDLQALFQLSPQDSYRVLFLGNHGTSSFANFFESFKEKWL
ncbi:MAG: hypothetical protein VX642_15780, partial [Bdellovibrionota bacterium]|nr:hypothetical protein [Bdellovibrionota bacterium]